MVHVFKYKEYNYIYDSGSGSLHECDDKTYDYLAYKLGESSAKPALSEAEIASIEGDLKALEDEGLLFKEEVKTHPAKSNEVKALCIHICHDCNLRCRYCFADEGAYRVLTREEVEGFLATLTPSAHNHALLSLGAAFSWAVKTGRLKETADPTRGLELVKLAAPRREVLTVEDGARVLSIAEASGRPGFVAYVAIGMFAGLRPEETLRLRPGDVGAEYITLTESATKTADARTVAIRPNLRAILDAYPVGPLGVAGGLTADRFRRLLRSTIEAGGVALPHDVLRHSFASYAYEAGRDAAATAYELGHKGTQMLFKHYRGLVPPGSGARWFALLPPSISLSSAHSVVS